MPPPVFRFAPSPNGYLHLGHALSALINFDMARAAGGRLLLRIEDIDATRCRPEFEAAIYEDLAWLGLAWEEPVRRQSEHLADYRAALGEARSARPCLSEFREPRARSRGSSRSARRDGPGRAIPTARRFIRAAARHLARGRARAAHGGRRALCAAARHGGGDARVGALSWSETGAEPEAIRVAAQPQAWGDVVLARKETPTSYHLSVVVDDALQGVTHVVRGQDLFWSTSVHRLLQALLGLPAPVYHHHRLILDADGKKLAKSTRATALRELRAEGTTPRDIRRMVGL